MRHFTWAVGRLACCAAGLGAAAGCGVTLRAVPVSGQVAVKDGRGVFEERDGLLVAAGAIDDPPIAANREFAAFGVELRNSSASAFEIDVARMRLGVVVDDRILDREPTLPDALLRAYQSADARTDIHTNLGIATTNDTNTTDASAVRVATDITPPELARSRDRGCPDRVYVAQYYWWHPYPPFYDDRDYSAYRAQEQRQRVGSFLARLLWSGTVGPHQALGGYVVFAQPYRKGDRLRLLVPVRRVAASTQPASSDEEASQPTTAPAAGDTSQPPAPTPDGSPGDVLLFEFHFKAK